MRTTITINDKLFYALKLRAVESNETMSKLVEDAIKYQVLEDLEDIEDAAKRDQEQAHSFDALAAQLHSEGLL